MYVNNNDDNLLRWMAGHFAAELLRFIMEDDQLGSPTQKMIYIPTRIMSN